MYITDSWPHVPGPLSYGLYAMRIAPSWSPRLSAVSADPGRRALPSNLKAMLSPSFLHMPSQYPDNGASRGSSNVVADSWSWPIWNRIVTVCLCSTGKLAFGLSLLRRKCCGNHTNAISWRADHHRVAGTLISNLETMLVFDVIYGVLP